MKLIIKQITVYKVNLLLLTAFLFLGTFQSNAQEKIVSVNELNYDKTTGTMNYNDEPFNGVCQNIRPNGMIAFKGNFKDGLQDGVWSFYHTDGKIQARKNYSKGVLNGYSEEYLEYGDLVKTNYRDGHIFHLFIIKSFKKRLT